MPYDKAAIQVSQDIFLLLSQSQAIQYGNYIGNTMTCRGDNNSQPSAKIHTKLEMADQFRERSTSN